MGGRGAARDKYSSTRTKVITIFYIMTQDVMILMQATSITEAIRRGGH